MAADQGYEVTEINIQQKSKFQQCWQSVSKSIYDPETKTFLTRTGSSWGKNLKIPFQPLQYESIQKSGDINQTLFS